MAELTCCRSEAAGVEYPIPLPDILNLTVIIADEPCASLLATEFGINFDGEGWSATFGAWTVWVTCENPSSPGSLVDLYLRWELRDAAGNLCDSGAPLLSGGVNCEDIFAVFSSWSLNPVCCGLGPSSPAVTLMFHVDGGPPRPNGKLPKTAPPCTYVPEDCCSEPPGPGCCEVCTTCDSSGPPAGCGCPTGGSSSFPPVFSPASVRYATGEVVLTATDLETGGYGKKWGHTRSFASRLSVSETLGNGFNWQVREWPYLVIDFDGSVTVQRRAHEALWFDKVGTLYIPTFNVTQTLLHNEEDNLYRLYDLDGTVTEFDDTTGMFRSQVDPGGNRIEVKAMASNGYNFTQVDRSYTEGEDTITEQFLYEYANTTGNLELSRLTLRRKVNAGAWTNISRVNYTYYGFDEPHGGYGDLKTVTTQTWESSQWSDTGTSYYRYYKQQPGSSSSSSSSSSAGGTSLPAHLVKYAVHPASYARLAADPNVSDPLTASNAQIALYADYYFEYDAQRRVTKEAIQGASRTYLFSYAESTHPDGYNSWKTKTTETLPDGTQNIIYSNYAGQTMLQVWKSGTDEWCDFTRYNADAEFVLRASPSAISGYDESYADLLHEVDGNYEFLKDNEGYIRTYEYHRPTGWFKAEKIQQGELGTPIKLREFEYLPCGSTTCGSSSSSSSSSGGESEPAIYFLCRETVYPSDTDQTKKIITSYAYTWYSGTCQVQEKTTTLPVVPTDQNGSGVAATRKDYFDIYGNVIWRMNERGFITRTKFDIPTGALTQRIDDVDTSVETDAPSGWTTPSGGGLNLVTDFEHDDHGRVTQVLGPSHTIDLNGTATTIRRATWMVFAEGEDADEVRTGQGYATGTAPNYTYTLVNPVSITKTDKKGQVLEQIQATRASMAGKLLASDTFAQSSYVRWTTNQYTDCCFLASTRVYHTIPVSGEGSSGTNYDETEFGYDSMKRRNRHVTPGGTITINVFDARGHVIKTYVGTDETGATEEDPTGGGAPGNNMVIVTENEYDAGADSGDGNITKQTQHVNATETRATNFTYDWRNRRTEVDGEIDFCQKDYYDNLDRVVKSERYDTTSSGNLIARSESKFDDRGQVYQTIRYAVNPSTGTVGNSLTDNTWFDAAGNVIKSLPAGSKLFTKTSYDSLGRATTRYVGYDLDETAYSEADDVTGDTILEQHETSYDNASNVIQSTTRQRYHNAPDTQTGALQNPSTTPKARVTYMASWHDGIGRQIAAANYGTNGGSALSRPDTVPARSDNVLVTSTIFDSVGNVEKTTDPLGMVTCFTYDAVGREVERVLNCTTSSSSSSSSSDGCPESSDANVTIRRTFNADGNVATETAVNNSTTDQTTTYVYGTTLSDSDIATSTLKRAEVYPDSADADDRITFKYNRQQQITEIRDQQGTVHSYEYDKLGRQTQDRVTTLGSGVDGAVRRIATTYEVRGMREKITSYDNATVGTGNVVNEVQFEYNDFGQIKTDYQSHSGAVNTMSTPKVQYGYANGSANTVRPASLTYPDGRVLTYGYGSADGIDDVASRIASLIDDDGSSTHLADYSYLGHKTFVEVDYTDPDIKYTLVGTAGGDDPDSGDIYRGFDRIGRVKDSYWYDYGSSADVDRIKYGYDRAGNRIWRQNTVADALGKHFDELYGYDLVHRLKALDRGTLTALKDAVTDKSFAECWSLDETGNWKNYRQDDDGESTWDLVQNRAANAVNEVTDITESVGPSWITPVYSRAGNMTTIPKPSDPTVAYTCTYDAWNRLVNVEETSTAIAAYEYDGANRRTVQKTYSGGVLEETRHLHYTEPRKWQILEERVDSSSNPDYQFIWGLRYIDDLIVRERDSNADGTLNERLYGLHDANWNITAVANSTGAVQERYAYSAYGKPSFKSSTFANRSASEFAWQRLLGGYKWDRDTGLYSIRRRSLHPVMGVWLQRDPLGSAAGLGLTEYVMSAPIGATDPSGLRRFGARSCYEGCAGTCYELYQAGGFWRRSWIQYRVCLHTCAAECRRLDDRPPTSGDLLVIASIGIARPRPRPVTPVEIAVGVGIIALCLARPVDVPLDIDVPRPPLRPDDLSCEDQEDLASCTSDTCTVSGITVGCRWRLLSVVGYICECPLAVNWPDLRG